MRKSLTTLKFRLTPHSFWYGDNLTASGKLFLRRAAILFLAVATGVVAAIVAGPAHAEIIGGALLGAAVSMATWAIWSYIGGREELRAEIKRVTEFALLQARLNQIASAVGAPLLDLESQIEHVTNARAERLAHFGSLDEFRSYFQHTGDDGYNFWDDTAVGRRCGHQEGDPGHIDRPAPNMHDLGWEDKNPPS